jgi:hypothetical protein
MKNKYIFMVGFPRSGTTYAQSLMMTDSNVYSFPETHIFTKGIRYLRLPEFVSNIWLAYYCFTWVKKNFGKRYFYYSFSRGRIIRSFFDFLGGLANLQGKFIILEKTPKHIDKINLIKKYMPNAKFIHVVRKYQGALPSYINASKFWDYNLNPELAMQRWLCDIYKSYTYQHNDINSHYILEYDKTVSDPGVTISEINDKFSLDLRCVSNEELMANAKKIVNPEETWKDNNLTGQVSKNKNYEKFTISEEFKDYIRRVL